MRITAPGDPAPHPIGGRDGKSLFREAVSQRVRIQTRTMDGIVEALSQGLRTGLDEVVAKTAAALANQRRGQ